MRLALRRVAEFTSPDRGSDAGFPQDLLATGYSIDSRTLQPGDLFIAVRGERMDGHDFVHAALAAGAVGAIVAESELPRFRGLTPDVKKLIAVPDTLKALHTLAMAVRKMWAKPLIGITGSAGKTTTKDAVAQVLTAKHHVLRSQGNLNNHFGLPLQLLRLEQEHDIAVIEMGMNHAGEIAALAAIASPTAAVVTCVAPVHLEFFDSVAGIARAKYELIEALPPDGIAILNADDAYVSQFGRDFKGRVLTYGIEHPADVRAENIVQHGAEGSTFEVVMDSVRSPVTLPLLGRHNVLNALAAIAAGAAFGVTPSEAALSLGKMRPPEKRGETLTIAGATVINDCYNSNPAALRSMVESLDSLPAGRRIVVAGEMLELGPSSGELHRQAGEHIAGHAHILVGVRGAAEDMVAAARARGMDARFVATPEEAGEILARELRPGDAVLLKASRGVRLERAIEKLREKLG